MKKNFKSNRENIFCCTGTSKIKEEKQHNSVLKVLEFLSAKNVTHLKENTPKYFKKLNKFKKYIETIPLLLITSTRKGHNSGLLRFR